MVHREAHRLIPGPFLLPLSAWDRLEAVPAPLHEGEPKKKVGTLLLLREEGDSSVLGPAEHSTSASPHLKMTQVEQLHVNGHFCGR